MKPVTVNRRVTALKAVLSKAVEWQVIQHHPLSNVKPLKVDKLGKVRYLTDEEEKRLREALDKHEANIREGRATMVTAGGNRAAMRLRTAWSVIRLPII